MIVGLKPVGLALARVVKMYADKDCIFLRVLHRDAVVERNKHVGVSRHDGLYLRLAQSALEALGYIERDRLFRWTGATVRTAIFPAVAGIHDYSGKGFGRVLNAGSSNRAACS